MPGLLLTGGSSRRLGVDKATLLLEGETLAVRSARVLASVCDPVLEVGPGTSGLTAVREDPPGDGPLAALVAGVSALETPGPVLVFACDLPLVDASLLERIAGWPGEGSVVPLADGWAQTTCARYSPAALAAAPRLLASGERSLRALVAIEPVETPELDAGLFVDVDTPADAARLGIVLPRSDP